MNNSTEIFTKALGLPHPWHVSSVSFEGEGLEKELHIELKFERGHKFSGTDALQYTAYDTRHRWWQHLNFFQHKCILHANVPRIKQEDGNVKTVEVPWARSGSGFTLLFEAYSMLLIENEMTVKKAAETMDVYPQRIWGVFNHWVGKAHQEVELGDMDTLGFDETSSKKGHNYVTVAVDFEDRKVVFATPGKGAKCIEDTVGYLENKGVDTDKVKQVSIDMSPAFISGCGSCLPRATIIFDKFHVTQVITTAMDELRKLERKGNELLKGHKYTFLKNKLLPEVEKERDYLMMLYPKLGEGYRLVQLFKDFWEFEDKKEAGSYLAFWCDFAVESKIQPFIKAAATIKAHWSGIINYIESRINNAILEGINSKIQLVKKRARGYRNVDNFINMIYFTCGKLKLDYPL